MLDDSTMDKLYARKMVLLTRHWSGKHRRVVQGIDLLTLLWTDGEALIPCDHRLYEKAVDGLSRNDHCLALLVTTQARGFASACVVFDSWYASLENLKANRTVNPDSAGNRPLGACIISPTGPRVHLQGYGFILVFLIVSPDGGREYKATHVLQMDELTCLKYAERAWGSEVYHRGLKQVCGVERAEVRAAKAQRNHINRALRAFLRLEQHRLVTGVSW